MTFICLLITCTELLMYFIVCLAMAVLLLEL